MHWHHEVGRRPGSPGLIWGFEERGNECGDAWSHWAGTVSAGSAQQGKRTCTFCRLLFSEQQKEKRVVVTLWGYQESKGITWLPLMSQKRQYRQHVDRPGPPHPPQSHPAGNSLPASGMRASLSCGAASLLGEACRHPPLCASCLSGWYPGMCGPGREIKSHREVNRPTSPHFLYRSISLT